MNNKKKPISFASVDKKEAAVPDPVPIDPLVANADLNAFLRDTNNPLSIREASVRELWEESPNCTDYQGEADRWRIMTDAGGPGLLAWCRAGFPAGRLDAFFAIGGAQ